jgi:hypothetical protein
MAKSFVAALALSACFSRLAAGQVPSSSAKATEDKPPATPVPAPAAAPSLGAPLRITDNDATLVARFPADNPFGAPVDVAAAAPVKPMIPKITMTDEMYVAIRVDAKGKATAFRRVRDPIPSVAADTQKSILRWSFDSPKKGGLPVDTWTSLRLDLSLEIDPLKIEQLAMTPVTRETPIATPFEWPTPAAWLEAVKATPPADGAVPLEQLDLPPTPKKYPWSADSLKRPFTAKLWVRVTSAGKLDRIVPIRVTDPFLIAYLKRGLSLWTFHPARAGNANVDSWNELTLSGTVDCSIELKQVLSLRKTLAGS